MHDALCTEYLCKFIGWKQPTWEYGDSSLLKEHIDKFEAARARGEKGPVTIFKVDEMASDVDLPFDVVAMSATEFVSSLLPSICNNLKIKQAGEPPRGYLNTTAGTLIFASACRKIFIGELMRNSETTTASLSGLIT